MWTTAVPTDALRTRAGERTNHTDLLPTRRPERATGELTSFDALAQRAALTGSDGNIRPDHLMQLQKSAGNAAVVSVVRRGQAARRASLLVQRRAKGNRGSGARPTAKPSAQRAVTTAPAGKTTETAPPEGEKEDTDVSEFTPEPAKAAKELAAKPKPKPQVPTPPAVEAKAAKAVKPPSPKVGGKSLVLGPAPKPAPKAPAAPPGVGQIIKKPAPKLPPTYKFAMGADFAPAVDHVITSPHEDPAFNKVAHKAKDTVKKAKEHPTGKHQSAESQAAAKPPPNDRQAQAEAHQADEMAAAKPGTFDEAAFVTAVDAAMAKAAPKNLDEAGDLKSRSEGMKETIGDKVSGGKQAAAGAVTKTAKAPPDLKNSTPKPVTEMKPLEVAEPGGIGASGAMPAPVPNEQIDMREGPAKVDSQMADAGVTEGQLAESNEPEFTGALADKKTGEEHSKAAPAEIRKNEAKILNTAGQESAEAETTAVGATKGSIKAGVAGVGGKKKETQSKDELKRKEVADKINSIYGDTKSDVAGILDGLDDKIESTFTEGEAWIRKEFTSDWNDRLDAYKDERYSGFWGKGRWIRDKFRGLPAKANQLFEESRNYYEKLMKGLVRRLGRIVTEGLTKATERIAKGRTNVATYVGTLKDDLAKYGKEAETDVNEKFNDLDSSVKDKFDELANSIAKKSAESQAAVDEELQAAKDANKGLIDKAIDAVKGVIEAIKSLKDMIFRVLSKIADAIGDIIAHPIRFFENFVSAVKQGVSNFANNIGTHLQKGILQWLLGSLADVDGIEIPDSFDVKGMLKLVLSVIGISATSIKQRLKDQLGEPAMEAIVKSSDVVQKLIAGGPGELWEMIVEKVSDFEDMVIGKIKDFIEDQIVKAGIAFLISLLNPVAAFIKACMAIYKVVMFFIDNGKKIMEFIETIIDAIADVAKGDVGGVAQKIEDSLAKLLPLAIGFLAAILNISGVAKTVKSIIDKVRKPVKKAMDAIITTAVKATAPIWKAAKRLANKGKGVYEKGKAKATDLYEKGKDKAGAAVAKGKSKLTGGGKTPPEDVAQHKQVAQAAAAEMKHPVPDPEHVDHAKVRMEMLSLAKKVEAVFGPQVKGPAKLSVKLASDEADKTAHKIGFKVVVAPNTVVFEDAVAFDTTKDGGLEEVVPNQPLRLSMTRNELAASPAAQKLLFAMAQAANGRMSAFGKTMLAKVGGKGDVTSILKRDTEEGFIGGVLEKCKRKKYEWISEMPDMVRGRFNLADGKAVRDLVNAIKQNGTYAIREVEEPKEREGIASGYPRYHAVVYDTSGMSHEWQIGTKATSEVFETVGIRIPNTLKLKDKMKNDIHDIEYDVLKGIAEKRPDVAVLTGIPAVRRKIAELAAEVGENGDAVPNIKERLTAIHKECSTVLDEIVFHYGATWVRQFYH